MVDVDMKLMPSIVIWRKICLWIKSLFRLSKDHGPKRHLNIEGGKNLKNKKDFVNVEDGGVHHKKYDGHCIKQWVRISKAT
jgi:hypothetical protein